MTPSSATHMDRMAFPTYLGVVEYVLPTQIFGASLLLFRRTALLGATMMTPVMVNILLINIFYYISVGAVSNAAFILACMLLLVWHQRRELFSVLWTNQSVEPTTTRKLHWIIRALILFAVVMQIMVGTLLAH